MSVPERTAGNGPDLDPSEAERRLRDMTVVKMEPNLAETGYWGSAEAEFANALAAERDPKRKRALNRRVKEMAHHLQGLGRDERENNLLREIERRKKRPDMNFPHPFPVFLSPVLRVLADGGCHGVEEIRQRIAVDLGLTVQDLALYHDSIHQSVFVNKVALALNRLVFHRNIVAGAKGRQAYRITPHGVDVLRAHPSDARVQDL